MIKDCEFLNIAKKRIDLSDKVYINVRELSAKDGVKLKREIEQLLSLNNNQKMIAIMIRSTSLMQKSENLDKEIEEIKKENELVE